MFEPVPAVAPPRPAVAKVRAASTRSAIGTPARRSTYCGVKGSTAAASASTPATCARTNPASNNDSFRITRIMPASTAGSSPGRACRCTKARSAHSVRRGSSTMGFMPRSTASFSRFAGFWFGTPPECATIGFTPTSSQVSASSNTCGPALQVPCSAAAMALPGWSMVLEVNIIGEPIAFIHAVDTGCVAG
jgi:hypothetical protein